MVPGVRRLKSVKCLPLRGISWTVVVDDLAHAVRVVSTTAASATISTVWWLADFQLNIADLR